MSPARRPGWQRLGVARPIIVSLAATLVGCAPAQPQGAPLVDPAWTVQLSDSSALFIGVHAVDANTVWAAGGGGRVARTTDGGATWRVTVVPGAEDLQFRDVHAFSPDDAFVLSIGNGPDSRIYRTNDGGATWALSFQNEDANAFFDCFSFWDANRGFAFSDSYEGEFTLISTADGGASWTRIDPAIVPDARPGEGAFASSGTCVVTRSGGLGWFTTGASGVDTRVIRTTDYGESWAEAITPIPSNANTAGIFSLAMRDDTSGAIVGGDYGSPNQAFDDVAITVDGGATWRLAGHTGLGGAPYAVAYVPGTPQPTLVAVSPNGSSFSTDNGRTWTIFDDAEYWSVAFIDAGAGWAVGRGRISRIARSPVP